MYSCDRLAHAVRIIFLTVGVGTLLALSGCGLESTNSNDYTASLGGLGGADLLIHLPLKAGEERMCTQGAGGAFSHQSTSTRYDIDIDTSNTTDEEVFAPVSGTARVHMSSATSGFGYHVNIDLGDGTYVLIAHLADIFLSDGEEVTEGQLLGYEGCTGNCTGDHIHIGLHQGDASQDAKYGTSIPATYWLVDATERTTGQALDSEDFVCGIRSAGDAQDGHFYESELSINLWHPDGTLVKTPDNARVYVLDEGQLRWIENETAFWSRGWSFENVTLISQSEFACYGEGAEITGESYTDAIFDTEGDLWLIYGAITDPNRFRARVRGIGWQHVMASWGLGYNLTNWPETHGDASIYLTDWSPSADYIGLRDGTLVKEEDASDVWIISGVYALPVETWDIYLLQNFFDHSLLVVEDGVVGELHLVGSCGADHLCLDLTAITTCGGGLDITGGYGSGGDDPDDDLDLPELVEEDPVEDDPVPDTTIDSILSVQVDYPVSYPELTLTVQPIFAVSSVGESWYATSTTLLGDLVRWSESGNWSGLLGVRVNVNMDTDGNGVPDDWYCYGHYTTAFLKEGVSVEITLDENTWTERDLVRWSPGSESDTHLGCSALLWFGSTSDITVGSVD